jgi:alpha-N-arabinofuranosidase
MPILDEHYKPQFMGYVGEAASQYIDKYDRNGPKIFVGEWATREGATPATNSQMPH